jgi:kynurenine/2-aminoadipate aminotransferase
VPPGFMHFDTDGRVIRVDTLAKCIAPGLRLGWISAPVATLTFIRSALVASTMGPSGHAMLAAHALTSAWGLSGFHDHLQCLQARYQASATVLCAALDEHCAGLAEWKVPQAGMFVWMRVTCCQDVQRELSAALIANKVAIVPGRVFHVRGGDSTFDCQFLRLAFCNTSDADLREGARRLGAVLRSCHANVADGEGADKAR